jgi:hypothetical protein
MIFKRMIEHLSTGQKKSKCHGDENQKGGMILGYDDGEVHNKQFNRRTWKFI